MNHKQTPMRALAESGDSWLRTAHMALAFARCLLRLSEKDPRRALETAIMFEMWLTFAASDLACEITAVQLNTDDGYPARQMYGALHVLVLLAHFVRYLQSRFRGQLAQLASSEPAPVKTALRADAPRPPVSIIDTS